MRIRIDTTMAASAIALAAACASSADYDAPPGYSLHPVEIEVPSIDADTVGPHRLSIERHFEGPIEERLLRIAESVYPPLDSIRAAASGGFAGAEPLPDEGPVWWYSEFDGIRLPYAITAHAVQYYRGLSRAFERTAPDAAGRIPMERSSLRYDATIDHQTTFELDGRQYEDVYVARLSLEWSSYCGNLCALSFERDRIVVLSRDGDVLAVDGDGPSMVVVS